MSTFPAAADRPPSSPTRSLRALPVAIALAPLLALGACTGDTASTTSAGPGATSPPSATSAGSTQSASGSAAGSQAATPPPSPTTLAGGPAVTDPALGHRITVKRVVRNASSPSPGATPAAPQPFELVAVQLEWRAGPRYSATIEPGMFSLKGGDAAPTPATAEFQAAYGRRGMPALTTAQRGQTKLGWLVFKVEPTGAHPLTLVYTRPAYRVSNTSATFPAQAFPMTIAP